LALGAVAHVKIEANARWASDEHARRCARRAPGPAWSRLKPRRAVGGPSMEVDFVVGSCGEGFVRPISVGANFVTPGVHLHPVTNQRTRECSKWPEHGEPPDPRHERTFSPGARLRDRREIPHGVRPFWSTVA